MSVAITPFGIGVIILVSLVFLSRASSFFLIAIMVALSPFQAATVFTVKVGNYLFGLQPGYFVAVIYLAKKVLEIFLSGKLRVSRKLISIYFPIFLFCIYALISSFIIPNFAEGEFLVRLPRGGHLDTEYTSVQFSSTNISQVLYLFVSILLAFFISHDVYLNRNLYLNLKKPYLFAIIVVCILGIYQVLAWNTSLYFPYDILYTSPTYSLAGITQVIAGAKRLSSTFAESSLVAQYLAGGLAFILEISQTSSAQKYQRYVTYGITILTIVTIVLTTSSTAYLSLISILTYFLYLSLRSRRTMSNWIRLLLLLFLLGLIATPVLVIFDATQTLSTVFSISLFEKVESISFEKRLAANLLSLDIFTATYGFGAGWGSHRASSWLFNIVGNAGIWGLIFLTWFTIRVYRYYKQNTGDSEPEILKRALAVSVLFSIYAGTIGVPNFSVITIWINIGWLMGLLIPFETIQNAFQEKPMQNSPRKLAGYAN